MTSTFPNSFDWDPDQQILTHISHTTSVNDPHHSAGWKTTMVNVWKVTDDGIVVFRGHQIYPDRYYGVAFRTRIEGDDVRVGVQGLSEERFSLRGGR